MKVYFRGLNESSSVFATGHSAILESAIFTDIQNIHFTMCLLVQYFQNGRCVVY